MAKYRLEDGFIVPPSHLELIAADHCILSCRGCNHASPALSEWFADAASVHRDFSVLARVYRPRVVKILGGEPLLHPELAELIRAARSTGISDYFQLTTNGVLLHRMDVAVLEVIDDLEISVYPGISRTDEILALARELTLRFGKRLTVNCYDRFRLTLPTAGTDDEELVREIYATCKIANLWGCHAVHDGYFYECPQRIYVPQLIGEESGFESDRIRIDGCGDFRSRLLAYLDSSEPSRSCTHCVGTVGLQRPHEQVPKWRWRAEAEKPSEELVDRDWLERSSIRQDLFDDCKSRTEWDPGPESSASWWGRVKALISRPPDRVFAPRRLPAPVRASAAAARRGEMGKAKAGCGPLELRSGGEGEELRIVLDEASIGPGYDGAFHVGAITASPPARGVPPSAGREEG